MRRPLAFLLALVLTGATAHCAQPATSSDDGPPANYGPSYDEPASEEEGDTSGEEEYEPSVVGDGGQQEPGEAPVEGDAGAPADPLAGITTFFNQILGAFGGMPAGGADAGTP